MKWQKLWRRLGIALSLREPPTVQPYGWSYFDHIVSLYVTLNSADDRANEVIAKSRERPDDLTWGDIFLLENVVFSRATDDMLARSAWILRERLRSIASPTIYQKYIDSGIPTRVDTPEEIALMRADLCRVVDVLHWYYALIPIRERIRKSLTIQCVLWVAGYTVLLAVGMHRYIHHESSFLTMLFCVIYSGIIGGYVSSQRRMQAIPSDGDPIVSVLGLENAGYYLWLSSLLGAIFAVILMLMFIGNILQGTIFPAFYAQPLIPSAEHGLSFAATVWRTLPLSAADYGKLFVWAFLAGFAERLVPDSLDRLSTRVLSSKAPGPPGPPLPTPQPDSQKSTPIPVRNGKVSTPPEAVEEVKKKDLSSIVLDNVMHTGEAPQPPEDVES